MSEEMPKDPMTPAQRQAIERAYQLLGEHFDTVLIAVDFETQEDDYGHELNWKGGYISALGLATYAQHRMLDRKGKIEGEVP